MATFASHWADLDQKVTVVSAGVDPWNADNPDHEQAARLAKSLELVQAPSFFGGPFWAKIGPTYSGRTLRRLFGLFAIPDLGRLWAVRAISLLEGRNSTAPRFDWIITSGPPHGVHAVGLWAKRSGALWAADFRDPLTDNRNYKPKTPIHKAADASFESMIMRNADLIIANTAGNKHTIEAHYPNTAARLMLAPNGFDPRDLPAKRCKILPKEKFAIVYLGTIRDYSQAMRFFDYFLDNFPDSGRKIELVHIGTRPFEGPTADRMRRNQQLIYRGFLPKRAALEALDNFAMGLAILPREKDAARTVPGKAYQYIGHGLPLLSIAPEGDLLNLTRQASGVAVDCEDIVDGAAKLDLAIKKWEKREWPCGYLADGNLIEKFNNAKIAAHWLEKMQEIHQKTISQPR